MGVLGICSSVGSSAAPPLGSWLVTSFGINSMFYLSSVLALISMLILIRLPETLDSKVKFRLPHLKVGAQDIFDPLALPAALVMITCYFSYGVLLTLAPDLSDRLHIGNRGVYFTLFTLASICTRFFAGKIADRIGRVPVIKASIFIIIISMLLFSHAVSPTMFYLGSIAFGFGVGIFFPALTAWTIDLGDVHKRGRALATMYIALEIAIGGGALVSGSLVGNHVERLPVMFYFSAFVCVIGLIYLYKVDRNKIFPLIRDMVKR